MVAIFKWRVCIRGIWEKRKKERKVWVILRALNIDDRSMHRFLALLLPRVWIVKLFSLYDLLISLSSPQYCKESWRQTSAIKAYCLKLKLRSQQQCYTFLLVVFRARSTLVLRLSASSQLLNCQTFYRYCFLFSPFLTGPLKFSIFLQKATVNISSPFSRL